MCLAFTPEDRKLRMQTDCRQDYIVFFAKPIGIVKYGGRVRDCYGLGALCLYSRRKFFRLWVKIVKIHPDRRAMAIQTVRILDDVKQQRDQFVALARQHRAHRVAVFGSIVRGELGADSDIDFLVEFEAGYKLRDHIRLTQSLQSLLGRRVHVADRSQLREEFRATILAEAQSL